LFLVVGLLALGASVGLARQDAAAAARTWPPFVLVAGLLLIGAVAYEDGTFQAAGALLDRLPGGEPMLYAVAMGLVAAVTVVLNLDTSVAFLTPVLVGAARRRGASEERLLYGCVFLSNAASLLLPGSHVTNLLVLSGTHVSGSAFLRSMALPWAAAVVVTVADGKLMRTRIALGGIGTKPWRSTEAENELNGQPATETIFRKAADAALREAKPQTQNGFKVELAKRCLVYALKLATQNA